MAVAIGLKFAPFTPIPPVPLGLLAGLLLDPATPADPAPLATLAMPKPLARLSTKKAPTPPEPECVIEVVEAVVLFTSTCMVLSGRS